MTKRGGRYEGTLTEIATDNSTVSFSDVKILGTEGRKKGIGEIGPSSETKSSLTINV